MIPNEIPAYPKYTLRDLRDVEQRLNRERYADRYALVLAEIARREPEVVMPQKTPRPLRDWLFEAGNAPHTAKNIVNWWESRRAFWNCWTTALFYSSAITCVISWFVLNISTFHISLQGVIGGIFSLLAAFCFWSIWWIFALIPINLAFCAAYFLDMLLNIPLRFLGWRLSIALFAMLLVLALLVAALPPIGFIVAMTHK